MKGRDKCFSGAEYYYFVTFAFCDEVDDDDDDAGWLRSKKERGDKDDEGLRMKMTKKVLRCGGEGERKGAVRWEKMNRRIKVENVQARKVFSFSFVCLQARKCFDCLFVCLHARKMFTLTFICLFVSYKHGVFFSFDFLSLFFVLIVHVVKSRKG